MTELKMKEMQLINWFGCPNLIYTRERIHLVAMLTTDEEMKKNLYRVCRFLAREEIAYRYPIMYEMIRKIFSPSRLYLLFTASVYLATAISLSFPAYLISGFFVSLPIKITFFIIATVLSAATLPLHILHHLVHCPA